MSERSGGCNQLGRLANIDAGLASLRDKVDRLDERFDPIEAWVRQRMEWEAIIGWVLGKGKWVIMAFFLGCVSTMAYAIVTFAQQLSAISATLQQIKR